MLHYSAPEDYNMATTAVVTFSPGMTNRTISVQTFTDSLVEGDETFSASLSLPVANSDRINLVDNIATATIQDISGKLNNYTLAATLQLSKLMVDYIGKGFCRYKYDCYGGF